MGIPQAILNSDVFLILVAAAAFYASMTLSGPGILRGGLLITIGGLLMRSTEAEFES